MEKKEQLYEGKAKKVFATEDPQLLIVQYKDDATAFNGLKKGTIVGKGIINNQMSNRLMAMLESEGVPTHFVQELSQRETLVKKVSIVPLEVIVRNIAAGSWTKWVGTPSDSSIAMSRLLIRLLMMPLPTMVPFFRPLNAVASSLYCTISSCGSSVANTFLALPS